MAKTAKLHLRTDCFVLYGFYRKRLISNGKKNMLDISGKYENHFYICKCETMIGIYT